MRFYKLNIRVYNQDDAKITGSEEKTMETAAAVIDLDRIESVWMDMDGVTVIEMYNGREYSTEEKTLEEIYALIESRCIEAPCASIVGEDNQDCIKGAVTPCPDCGQTELSQKGDILTCGICGRSQVIK